MDPLCDEFFRLRTRSGWSQAEAARNLKVSRSLISRYEKGLIRPKRYLLENFANRIGERLLIGGEDDLSGDADGFPVGLADWEKSALRLLRRIVPSARKSAIKGLADFLAGFPVVAPGDGKRPTDPVVAVEEDETDDERHKRVADALGEALLSELDAARKARGEPTTAKESEQPPRDPSRSTTQRSVPGHRRSTT